MHWVNFIIAITSLPPSFPSVPPSHPSLQFGLLPPPHLLGRGGGGVNNNVSIFSAVHEISRMFEILPPPPIPLGTPPPEWGGSKKKLVSGQFMTFPGLFILDPLKPPCHGTRPPPGGTLIFLGSLYQCLSDETLKAVGPFYLVYMPGEVKDPTSPHWNV